MKIRKCTQAVMTLNATELRETLRGVGVTIPAEAALEVQADPFKLTFTWEEVVEQDPAKPDLPSKVAPPLPTPAAPPALDPAVANVPDGKSKILALLEAKQVPLGLLAVAEAAVGEEPEHVMMALRELTVMERQGLVHRTNPQASLPDSIWMVGSRG